MCLTWMIDAFLLANIMNHLRLRRLCTNLLPGITSVEVKYVACILYVTACTYAYIHISHR